MKCLRGIHRELDGMSKEIVSLCCKTNLWEEYLPSNPEWIDDIKPLDDFFSWLENCVSDLNCISPEELNTYDILSESGKFEVEEQIPTNKNHQLKDVDVYPHSRDLVILEDLHRQNQIRLASYENYFKIIKTQGKTAVRSQLGSKIDRMLDTEIRKISSLIAGEYRRSALGSCAKCSQMEENMKNISENVNASDLVCLSSTNHFFDLMEFLKLYIIKCRDAFRNEMNKRHDGSTGDHSSSFVYPDGNLERVFNDSIRLKDLIVKLQSKIEGVTEISNALDQPHILMISSNGDHPVLPDFDELSKICYDQVKTEFLRKEVTHSRERLSERRDVLAFLENLRSVARPLKLCGESLVLLIKKEFVWIRINKALLSDSLGGVQEMQHQIEQSYKQLVNMRTVHELSSAAFACPDVSSTFLKFFDVSSSSHNDTVSSVGSTWSTHCPDKKTVETVMAKMSAGKVDSAFKMMKSFSGDVMNLLSFTKMAHCYLFNGPSATFPVDADLISYIIQISRELKSKKEKLEKLDCHRLEVEIHRRNNEHWDLMQKLWLLYVQDPHQLRQTVEAIEARAEHSRIHHHATKASDSDCLEKFLL
ncbi:hypothetical protein GE061_012063 [Apolygus lucorum]|uniref:HAUS augmin-like complex subunit 3 N-terminal domain-containing protein n=1 Tax=Apolygus lucorum TaxID=248454 RepID=A0A8S9XRA7_APOLU|nr:hypothetical protein GE061_012063 [Apolygus lucorum]